MMTIYDRYTHIQGKVSEIATRCGRDPAGIQIVAVTKTVSPAVMTEAIRCGIRILGESRVQEAGKKASELEGDYSFHLVGHLQSNKASEAVKLFDLIHSIDKESTALKVNTEAEKTGKRQKILIQVNTSGEGTKNGIEPEKAVELASSILNMPNLELVGLMTIGPFTEDENNIRACFSRLRRRMLDINQKCGIDMKELSMGMSSDYGIAVEEGATLLRIGTSIFGDR